MSSNIDTLIDGAAQLVDLETRIERGLETFVDVGLALLEIRDGRLYRLGGYQRFEDYCQERWGWERRRAYQLIEGAQVVQQLGVQNFAHAPKNDAQARELARLKEPEAIKDVWQEVRETHPEPTARVIREAVERRLNPTQEYVCTECGEVHPTRECPNCSSPQPSDEVAQMNRIFTIVGDESGNIGRASLHLAYSNAIKFNREKCIPLDPSAVIGVLDQGEIDGARWFIHDMRQWLDRLEAALRRGLHTVEV